MGYRLNLSITPSKRPELESICEITDGQINRVYDYNVENQTLIRVNFRHDYAFFKKKHKALAIKLNKTLLKMQKEGLIQEIKRQSKIEENALHLPVPYVRPVDFKS